MSKRQRSTEQRLRAIREKKAQLKARKLSIDVLSAASRGQHVVFASDSDEPETDSVDIELATSLEHEHKLELFESSSGSELEGEEELKANISGDCYGQLTELQLRIGHDKRFRVDHRFLEEEEEEGEGGWEEGGQAEPEDQLGQQIQQEKANALKIINSLFKGGQLQSIPEARHSSPMTEYPTLLVRYDPSSSSCAQLELGNKPDSPCQREEQHGSHDPPSDESHPPPAHGHTHTGRYFSVSENIKDLFDSSQGQFNFIADVMDDSDEDRLADNLPPHTSRNTPAPNWIKTVSKLSSDSEGRSEFVADKCEASSYDASVSSGTKLFFHSLTPSLRNRLDENRFYCTRSLKELEKDWPERRTIMKQSFRRRRTDAVKFTKKRRKNLK